jgi:3',5'-cyclic AMP phosphodiesterase CpdA
MSVVLQISDTHFGTEQSPVVEALVALALQQQPDVVVLSGDITQRAHAMQFRQARSFVDRLAAPVVAIPGNHDIPLINIAARLLRPYAAYSQVFGSNLEPTFSSTDLLVVCVNTTRRYRHQHGEVSQKQIDRVAQLLYSATAEQLRVVVVHQPIAVMNAQDKVDLLRNHAAAQQQWAAAGADLVMGGHIHLPYTLALPGLARPMWAVQAGTGVSRRVRAGVPNSVNLVRWGSAQATGLCHIEQWDFDAASEAFACTSVTQVVPARAGYGA